LWGWQVNNAAVQFMAEADRYQEAVDTIETNYFGVRRVTEKLLPLLRASPFGARIVMVSSQVGQMEVPTTFLFCVLLPPSQNDFPL